MSPEQIAQIAKLDYTNADILSILAQYQDQIISWLSSREFQTSIWASKPYPPLLNPEKTNYAFLNPAHAWLLNLPLPRHYDFIAFGSAFSGLSLARAFLLACDAHAISPSGTATSMEAYMRLYNSLLIYADMREKDEISSAYLLLDEFILDNDAQKLYSLLDASKALHVVNDPICALASSLCASKLSADFVFDDAQKLKSALKTPDINETTAHLANIKELYHDGFMFKLLSASMKNLCLKQKSDFSPERAFETTCELAASLGLKSPEKSSFFSADPGLFAGILPLQIRINDELCLHLSTCYDSDFGIFGDNDISPAFSLAHTSMRVLLGKADDALILLKDKELFAKAKERVEVASKDILELAKSAKASISEAEILEFLLTQAEARKLAKSVLDQHLMILKQVAPALVQTFTRYQAFELLCAKDM